MGRATVRRSRARRGEGPRLRAEILAAAERLLIDTGDESAVSIRAVAEAVGVTSPSIYMHFSDRNELIFAVCEEQFRHLDDAMEAAVVGITDPAERIARKGRAYVQFGLANPEQYRILFTSRPDCTPARFMDERLIATTAFGHLTEDVEAAIGAGQIRSHDTAVIASGLWMVVHGVTSLLIAKPDFPWPERQLLIDYVLQTYAVGLWSDPASIPQTGPVRARAPACGPVPAGESGLAGASG